MKVVLVQMWNNFRFFKEAELSLSAPCNRHTRQYRTFTRKETVLTCGLLCYSYRKDIGINEI